MINAIDTGLTLGNKSLEFIDIVIQKISKYQKIKQDTTAYLRLLYLEVVNNLEVFETINFDKYSSLKPNDEKVKTILKLLQTDIAESIFYKSADDTNAELYEKLKKKGKIEGRTTESSRNSENPEKSIYENVLQAISFVVTKIEVMRKYSLLSDNELDILKNMNFKTRLININQRLAMIKKTMDSFDEIKEMAR